MAQPGVCPACGTLNEPAAGFCVGCGVHLNPVVCPQCGAQNRTGARFCAGCSATLAAAGEGAAGVPEEGAAGVPEEEHPQAGPFPADRRRKQLVLAGVSVGVVAAVGVAAFFLLRGGDGEGADGQALEFARPGPVDQQLVAGLQEVVKTFPTPTGATDRDQLESLMGPPDAFSISFEQDEGGKSERIVRYDTWFYFEFQSAFEFVDGDLLSNMPVDDVAPLAILPRQYRPGMFRRDMTWEDVKKLVQEPDAFYRADMPEAYGAKVWAYYGEQLMVAFDEQGLSYVETYPLEPGGRQ